MSLPAGNSLLDLCGAYCREKMRQHSRRHPRLPTAFPSRGIFAPPGPPGGITGQMQHTNTHAVHARLTVLKYLCLLDACCGSRYHVSISLQWLGLFLFGEVQAAHDACVQVGIMTGCHSHFWAARQACLEAV